MSRPWVYVAGPYTQPDPAVNTRTALRAGDRLWDAGAVPIVPHLTHLWHLVEPQPYAHWLALGRELLTRCDALLRLPGASPGADEEVALAKALDIPVLDGMERAQTWLARRACGA
jgi:hypothetical protein